MPRRGIKVLYYITPTTAQILSGAAIQMLKTKEYIEKMDPLVSVGLFDVFKDRLENYDILHIFGTADEGRPLCEFAKLTGLKVCLSPNYWPSHTERIRRTMVEEVFSGLRRFLTNLRKYDYPTFKRLEPYKDFLDAVDMIFPNSVLEAELIRTEFGIDPKKLLPVPNAVDRVISNAKPDLFEQSYGVTDFVLFVGRIEARKNLLGLLEAYKNIQIPLVIIGSPSNWEPDYFVMCKKVAERNKSIRFLGSLPHSSEELLSAYAAAKVFVLPSWCETPGLAALEAGAVGCNLVITSRGSTTEYFRDYALYVDPGSTEDIEKKILAAYEKPRSHELRNHILKNYTWERTAERTLEAYDSLLSHSC